MSPQTLSLSITTPLDVLFRADDIRSFRARDGSGEFGILPGHADFLTVLNACVARWQDAAGKTSYCAVRGGVLTVSGGSAIGIACREGILSDDLAALEQAIAQQRAGDIEASSRARVSEAKLHAKAVRQIMRRLAGRGVTDQDMPLEDLLQ